MRKSNSTGKSIVKRENETTPASGTNRKFRGTSKPRGRNQFTKAALGRVYDVALKKGAKQFTLELPGGGRITIPVGDQDKQEPSQKNEWDEELYGKNPPPVR
jgi:hypothetical protein